MVTFPETSVASGITAYYHKIAAWQHTQTCICISRQTSTQAITIILQKYYRAQSTIYCYKLYRSTKYRIKSTVKSWY